MNIEHSGLLSWFHESRDPSKRKKPCARWRDADCDEVADSASGDPAMVFMFRMASILPMVRASCPLRPAAGLLLDALAHDRFRKPQPMVLRIMQKTRATSARELNKSTTNA